jgi:hypothetical protein
MSFLDRFFKKYPIIIGIKIESPRAEALQTKFLNKMKIIEQKNNTVIIKFDHADMDGITVIQNLLFADQGEKDAYFISHDKKDGVEEQKLCLDYNDFIKYVPSFSLISTMNHLKTTFKTPFLKYPNSNIECFSIKFSLSKLQKKYQTLKEKIPNIKFSTFLCALQCQIFRECTKASFLKLQILHYLPMIQGNNKIFPDNMILYFDNEKEDTFISIVEQIHKKRRSVMKIYNIWKNYAFFSKWGSIPDKIPMFDISFSSIPFLTDFDSFEFLEKSLQFEKCSVLCISNKKDSIFFCVCVD